MLAILFAVDSLIERIGEADLPRAEHHLASSKDSLNGPNFFPGACLGHYEIKSQLVGGRNGLGVSGPGHKAIAVAFKILTQV